MPLALLLDYVSVEQLSLSGSKVDHFEIVNIGLRSQILASVFGSSNEIVVYVPFNVLIPYLTLADLQQLCKGDRKANAMSDELAGDPKCLVY